MRNIGHMAQMTVSLLACIMMISFSACGKAEGTHDTQRSESALQSAGAAEDEDQGQADLAADGNENGGTSGDGGEGAGDKILIAYFTAAENSGVDAVSSASYTIIGSDAVGRVRAVADMIQAQTGGDLFSILTSTIYPADGGELIEQAAEEQDADFRPELTSHLENLDDYEIIFIGYPNWWYDMPMAMYSFFEEYDFSGKTIIPFNVHNGSRFSGTISTIQELEPDALVVEEGFTVSERNVAEAGDDVREWLEDLGY